MTEFVKIAYGAVAAPKGGTYVVFVAADVKPAPRVAALLGAAQARLEPAAKTVRFRGKPSSAMDLIEPAGLEGVRLLVVGVAPGKDGAPIDFTSLGGFVFGKLGAAKKVAVAFLAPAGEWDAAAAAEFALGLRLRAYRFDKYKNKKNDGDDADDAAPSVTIEVAEPAAARAAFAPRLAIAEGVELARTLVNEPPNVLFPESFAARALELKPLGVEVEALDDKAMAKLGMNALLGVGQGSKHGSRLVVMRWRGAPGRKSKPVVFVGKGVCFDSGGISIKPAAGMEDMKGDMAGAACVVGLMRALAARKAKVDAVGVIGLVENMPGGGAYRPSDILKSMSGQTIEVINTDAEGRLVLADALTYAREKFKPRFMIDLATLTGAIMVALGQEHAGLFSNDDELAARLSAAGVATGETVWRMPLGSAYDKMIDSRFADMKNTGGRNAGAITAAQFLKRFVGDTPWAHLDIAGTGMSSPANDINQSWGSGWGVRLLDRLVAEYYES
ncbi:MAG: leucyl aminopeptidase [Bradyrhizobium sp.]|nr:MAG: leucyl aminopeptidase [Bradyrhizobium sp.]